MSRYVIEKVDGEFVIPVSGFVCVGWEDYGWLLVRDDESGDVARIGLDREEHRVIAANLVRAGAAVGRVVVKPDGTLVVELDGTTIERPPVDEFEAWEVRGPGDVLVVCLPGGGEPAIWDATSETLTIRAGEPVPPDVQSRLEAFGLQLTDATTEGEDP